MASHTELKYFLEVANSLNLSRASERLSLSQPSLSVAIKRDDYYKNASYETMRKNLIFDYAESENNIKQNIKEDEISLKQFNGIHRFIYEDILSHLQLISKNKIRKISKEITYQVVQRSNAWSVLVEKTFPYAIRLSIHPQLCGSSKIGIMLLKSNDAWATPWHRVVLYDGKEHILIRKKDAENQGATPIFIKNQFSHYTLIRE